MLSFRYLFLAGLMVLSSLPADRAGICGYQSRSKANSPKDGCIEAGCIADSPEEPKNRAVEQKRREEPAEVKTLPPPPAPAAVETDSAPPPYEPWNEQAPEPQPGYTYEPIYYYEPDYTYQPVDYRVEDCEYVESESYWLPCLAPPRSYHRKILIAAKGGYFYPLDSTTRDIASGGVASSFEVNVQVMGNWYAWASAGYIRMEGSTIAGEDPVTLEIVPAGLGLKYIYPIRSTCLDFYLGAGILPTYVKTTDESPFLQKIGRDFDFGGVVKGGLLFNFSSCIFLDLFVDYNVTSIHCSDASDPLTFGARANLDGLSIGGGLGLRF